MKNEYISTDISMYTILTKYIIMIAVFVKKTNFVHTFDDGEFKSKYSIYATTIKIQSELPQGKRI